MANQTTNQSLVITTSEKQAREIINEYMGNHVTRLTISHFGRELWVELFYRDFKPTRTVQRYLEDRIPNINFQEIERDYSDQQMLKGLEYTEELFPEIYVKEADGCLRPASPLFLGTETLKHIDLTQSDNEILEQVRQASPKYQELQRLVSEQRSNDDAA